MSGTPRTRVSTPPTEAKPLVVDTTTTTTSSPPKLSSPTSRPSPVSRRPLQQRSILNDMLLRNDTYHDVLQYVLMQGGPDGFDVPTAEDPLHPGKISTTLHSAAERLMEGSKRTVMPSVASVVAKRRDPGASASSSVVPSRVASPSTDGHGSVPSSPSSVPPPHQQQSCSGFTPEQQSLYDDAVYFVTLVTSRRAIDDVLEDPAYRSIKRTLTDALLFGLSLMCRFPVPLDVEDDTGRPIIQVMVQGMVSILVNMDVLLDLHFLNATRGCRVADLIRWCQASKKKPLLDLGAGLSTFLVCLCFPRLPADFSLSLVECRGCVDAARRSYCGYDDCEGVVSDIGSCFHGNGKDVDRWWAYRDIALALNRVRRYFLTKSQWDAAPTTSDSNAKPMEVLEKQHPWMVAGSAKELHYICTVPLRALEEWLHINTEEEFQLIEREEALRSSLAESVTKWITSLRAEFDKEERLLRASEILRRKCNALHAEELGVRKDIEDTYDLRIVSIKDDLRRLKWHILQWQRQEEEGRGRPLLESDDGSGSTSHAGGPILPRLYYLEAAELQSVASIESKHREDIIRQERYAFSAFRETWELDFQYLQEMLAEEEREKVLREAYRIKLLKEAAERATSAASVKTGSGGGFESRAEHHHQEERSNAVSVTGHVNHPESRTDTRVPQPWLVSTSRLGMTSRSMLEHVTAPGTVSGASTSRNGPQGSSSSRNASRVTSHQEHYEYYNPHSTAPSSLGYGPSFLPSIVSPVFPTTRTRHHGDAQHTSAVTTSAVVSPDDTDDRDETDAVQRRGNIIVGARVVSPDPEMSRAQHMQRLLSMVQDFLDDQDIERCLVEEEETSMRAVMSQKFKEGRLMQFDWSMNGYRRIMSGFSSGVSPRGSDRMSSPSWRSPTGVTSPRGVAAATTSGGSDYERMIPSAVAMRATVPSSRTSGAFYGTTSQGASYYGTSSTPTAGPPTYATTLSRDSMVVSSMSPRPPSTMWGGGTTTGAIPAASSRPTSRLLPEFMRASAVPPKARYGAIGLAQPDERFMPRKPDVSGVTSPYLRGGGAAVTAALTDAYQGRGT